MMFTEILVNITNNISEYHCAATILTIYILRRVVTIIKVHTNIAKCFCSCSCAILLVILAIPLANAGLRWIVIATYMDHTVSITMQMCLILSYMAYKSSYSYTLIGNCSKATCTMQWLF